MALEKNTKTVALEKKIKVFFVASKYANMADGEKKECLSMSSKGCQDVIGFAGPSKVRCVLETFE